MTRRDKLADCLIGTGFPFRDLEGVDEYLEMFALMTRSCARPCVARAPPRWTRPTWPAAALDGFFERGLKPWDMAAGMLLITEAGGLVGNYAGRIAPDGTGRSAAAGNPKAFAQMVRLLSPFSLDNAKPSAAI